MKFTFTTHIFIEIYLNDSINKPELYHSEILPRRLMEDRLLQRIKNDLPS